jgi:hypothetical protein
MAYVTATISGYQCPPEYWTNFFGVMPTFYVEKGVPFVTPSGKQSTGIGKSNIWGCSTKGIITADVLNPHLSYLISQLKLPRQELKTRLEGNQSIFRLTCFWANFTHDRVPIIEKDLEDVVNNSGGVVLIDEYY